MNRDEDRFVSIKAFYGGVILILAVPFFGFFYWGFCHKKHPKTSRAVLFISLITDVPVIAGIILGVLIRFGII